jgi:hypothetical protein
MICFAIDQELATKVLFGDLARFARQLNGEVEERLDLRVSHTADLKPGSEYRL